MKRVVLIPVVTSAAFVLGAGAAHSDRDLPRPSRADAPARFGTVQYSQWYAKQAAAIRYGWGPKQFKALKWIWHHESGWNHRAVNPSSGATGIPQSLPASKMRTHGSDYRTNPETQIDWGLDYIKERYGSPIKAKRFWLSHNWY
jgi:soluble lytic murein transglycosylase-like protein